MTELATQSIRELHACIIPWRSDCNLLLPGTIIADTLYHLDVVPFVHESDWVNGGVEWRGQTIPLISFDQVPGLPAPVEDENRRALICHTLSFNKQHAYIAIDFYRLPRLLFVDEASIEILEGPSTNSAGDEDSSWPFFAKAEVRGSNSYILDMKKLCSLI